MNVPPGHPWSCDGCKVTVQLERQDGNTIVTLAHDDDCPTFLARLETLAPEGMDLSTASTIRPGGRVDLDAAETLFPEW
jgi:hypothetical protein